MTKKQKKMMKRLVLSAVCLIAGVAAEEIHPIDWICFLISYLAAGYDIPMKAFRNIRNGQVFDENFLMTVATFGAIVVGELTEAVAVMLFYQVGELFSDYAVNKSRKSITDLMDINPEYANVLRDGEEEQVEPDEVEIGEVIIIKPGEKVPLDGIVRKGSSSLDTKALTGESMPMEVTEGQNIVSGSINLNGLLEVEVTKLYDDSTVAKILELVENASSRKAKAENFITKFARVYTPIVVCLALALAFVPPLIQLAVPGFAGGKGFGTWMYRACSFLVVSCPCALVISVPLSFFGGLGAASRNGILIKGSNYLEAMASLDTVVFDKTGTLTTGKFQVTSVEPVSGSREELLALAAYGESSSNHPIALSVMEAYETALAEDRMVLQGGKKAETKQEMLDDIISVEEIAGHGMHVVLNWNGAETALYIGNEKLMKQQGISMTADMQAQETTETICQPTAVSASQLAGNYAGSDTTLYVAANRRFLGTITISDTIREDVPEAIKGLRREGVTSLVMLTGDKESVGKVVAEKLGLNRVFGNLLPGDKVHRVEELLSEEKEGKTLAFVGDGINDAPVLARADIGIAMGGIGSDAAVEAADVVIMNDEPSKIVDTIQIARKTVTIVKQNIVFAIGVKVLVLILVALGMTSMWAAVFGDVGVSVLAILNSIRALKYKRQ